MLVTKLHISPKLEQNCQFNTIYDYKLGIISYATGYHHLHRMCAVNLEAFVILLRLIDPINRIVQQRLKPQSH